MSLWLDSSNNGNKFKQSYFKGFVDISGGGLYLRNDMSLNFYDNTNSPIPNFSIKSNAMRILDSNGIPYDLSTSTLLYLLDLSQNVQSGMNDLISRTKHIMSDTSDNYTMLQFDISNNTIQIYGNINTTGTINTITQSNSTNSNAVATTAYVKNQGYATLAYPSFIGTVSIPTANISQQLSVNGDVSLNNKLYVFSDATFNRRINVSSDANINGRLIVFADSSMNGNVNINGNVTVVTQPSSDNSNKVATTAFIKNQGYASTSGATFSGDVSINSKLFMGGDVSMNSKLFIGGDVSMNGNVSAVTQNNNDNSSKIATTAYVQNQGYATLASPNFTGTVSIPTANISQNVNIQGDTSMNGNVHIYGNMTAPTPVTSDNSQTVATTAYVQNQGYATLTSPTFTGQVTASNNLSVSNDATMNSRLFVIGDTSLNGNLTVFGNVYANTQLTTDNSTKVATTAFVKNQGYAKLSGASFSGDVTANNRLVVNNDSSFNANVVITGITTLQGTSYANTPLTTNNSTQIATTAYVQNQGYATLNSPVFTGVPYAPTPSLGSNNAQIATTQFVISEITSFVNAIPQALDAINQLSAALSNSDASFAVTLANEIGTKANIDSPSFTGTVTMPTTNIIQDVTVSGNTTLNGNVFMNQDVSMSGLVLSVTPANTDNSTTVATTAFVKNQHYAPLSGATFTGVVNMNNELITNSDVSMNARLLVGADVSLNANVFAAGTTTLNNATVLGNLTLITPVSSDNSTTAATTAFVKNQNYAPLSGANFTGDVSLNQNLIVGKDASMNGNLFLYGYASLNNNLFVIGDASFNKNVYVANDISNNGNLHVGQSIYENGVSLINKYATLASPTFTGTVSGITSSMVRLGNVDNTSDINKPISTATQNALNLKANIASPTFTGVVSMPTTTVSQTLSVTGDVSMNSKLFVNGDVSMNGNVAVPTPATSDNSQKVATTAYVQNQGFAPLSGANFTGDVSMNSKLSVASDVSMNSRLFVGSDASFEANLFVNGKTVFNGDVFTYHRFILGSDISSNGKLLVNSDISANGNLFIGGDISANGNVNINGNVTVPTPVASDNSKSVATTAYVQNQGFAKLSGANFTGDVSMNSRLLVSSDVSMNGKLTIYGDASFNSNLLIGNDISMNGNLYVNGVTNLNNNVTTNGNMVVTGDSSMNGNLNVNGYITTSYNLFSTDNSNRVATTSFVKNQGYAKLTSPSFSGTPTAPTVDVSIVNNQVATTSYVSNAITAFFNAASTETLNSINQLSAALSNTDSSFTTLLASELSLKANVNSPSFTGTVTAPTLMVTSDLDVQGDSSMNGNLIVGGQIYENGVLLEQTYAPLASPTFTGTVTGITASMVGLGNVNNTSDINKPISTATQSALNLKANIASPSFTGIVSLPTTTVSQTLSINGDVSMNSRLFVSGDLSMGGNLYANYPANTIPYSAIIGGTPGANGVFTKDISANNRLYVGSDASFNKKLFVTGDTSFNSRLYIGSDASFNGKLSVTGNAILQGKMSVYNDVSMGGNLIVANSIYENGVLLESVYAPLNTPNFVGTATFEKAIVSDLLTVNADTDINGRLIVSNDVRSNGNLYGNTIYENGASLGSTYVKINSPTFTGTVSGITPSMVGLGNVDNTSDINKPISTATQSALDLKASLASPTFTGTPIAPTAISGTNTTQIATTQFVRTEISNLVGTAPSTLDTLQQLATAINSDASFATTVTTEIGLKAPINNPSFTGIVEASKIVVTGDVSFNNRLYAGSDTSLNANLYVGGNTVFNGDVSLNGNLYANYPNESIPSTAIQNIRNQYGKLLIQTQRADIVTFDDENFETSVSSGYGGYVETLYSEHSDLSLNGNLYVSGGGLSTMVCDLSLSGKLYTGSDLYVANTIYESGQPLALKYAPLNSPTFAETVYISTLDASNLLLGADSSMNGNLYVGQKTQLVGDVSMNSLLDISGSIIAHTNLNVYGIINQYTTTLDEGYKVNYDTQAYIQTLQQQVATLQSQMASVLQILSNHGLQ